MLKYVLVRFGILLLALSMCSCTVAIRAAPQRRATIVDVVHIRDVASVGSMRPVCAGPCEPLPPCAAYMPHGTGHTSGCAAL